MTGMQTLSRNAELLKLCERWFPSDAQTETALKNFNTQ
jgi:hypothetical protein